MNPAGTSSYVPAMGSSDAMTHWQGGSSNLEELNLLGSCSHLPIPPNVLSTHQQLLPGIFKDPNPLQADLTPLSPTSNNLFAVLALQYSRYLKRC